MTDPDPRVDAELLVDLDEGVLWLTINREEAGNALPYYVRDALIEQFTRAHSDYAVRAVVLTGAGARHFCTGADLRVATPRATPPPDGPEQPVGAAIDMMREGFQRLVERMQDCQKPIIVALNGTAAGGGASIALAADLVVASDTAKLVQVFVRRGLVADGGAAYLLPRIVGMHKAKELLFLGDDLDAESAAHLGIVNAVVPAAELEATTRAWAQRLAAGPTKAIGFSKRLLHDAIDVDRGTLLMNEAMYVELNSHTEDAQEGVASFVERRPSHYRGW